jgi:hypothetical protein
MAYRDHPSGNRRNWDEWHRKLQYDPKSAQEQYAETNYDQYSLNLDVFHFRPEFSRMRKFSACSKSEQLELPESSSSEKR